MLQLPIKPQTSRVRSNVSASCHRRNWLNRAFYAPLTLIILMSGCGDSSSSDTTELEPGSPVVVSDKAGRSAVSDQRETSESPKPDAIPEPNRKATVDIKTDPPESPKQPQQVYRPNFSPRTFDDQKLASLGIRRFASRRLILYTDIDPELARSLPAVIDKVYDAWTEYFGEIPPARDGREFQITGFVIRDRQAFDDLGLIPVDLPPFIHGRHRGLEFWMLDQETDYYRRHLLIHEATHCFMTIVEPAADPRPVWYLEGMAEIFGTHQTQEDEYKFRVMPDDNSHFPGLGRITLVRTETDAGRHKSLADLINFAPTRFLRNDAYGWTWAMCEFLDRHPRWKSDFRRLGQQFSGASFRREFVNLFEADVPRMNCEWQLFTRQIVPGYDLERAAVKWEPVQQTDSNEFVIESDRGWQSTGIRLVKGRPVRLTAEGDAILAETTRPWLSHPDGITVLYVCNHPLGQLLACVYVDSDDLCLLKPTSFGSSGTFVPDASGILLLKINDAPDELADNRGHYLVRQIDE